MPVPILTPVESSTISGLGHDRDEKAVYVQFKGGALWKYSPITYGEFQAWLSEPSIGSHFHKHVKNNPGITAQRIE